MDAPSRKFVSLLQKQLFESISKCGDLIFACGPLGVSANFEGPVRVTSYENEDRLEMGDGTFHVHIDWTRIQSISVTSIEIEGRSEGLIDFFDGEERLFRLYRPTGLFPESLREFEKADLTRTADR